MVDFEEVFETNAMIKEESLDVRTITMGINLLSCCDSDPNRLCENIYNKIVEKAKNLVSVGDAIGLKYGIPITNKRVSVTPISLVGACACKTPEDFVKIAKALDKAAEDVGINFIGGYSALVEKGMSEADKLLIESIPEALSTTERVCSSVSVASTRTGINMDAVRKMGDIIREIGRAHV